MSEQPLVSIGLPCYNRAGLIGRAIESALNQEYPNLELVISDNASTDGTEAICRAWAARDSRVVYIRQETNRGATANFDVVFQAARGDYFLWLGDDDWLDLNYVSSCLRVLEANPDYVAAYGRGLYYRGDELVWDRPGFNLLQEKATERVVGYYAQVDDNTLFYGVFRRSALEKAGPLVNVAAGDWLLMAAVAFQGKVALLNETSAHRLLGGTSDSYQKIAVSLGLHPFYGRIFMLRSGWEAARAIFSAPVYAPLGRIGRLTLALRCQPWFWKRYIWAIYFPLKGQTGERIFALSKLPLTRPFYEITRWGFRAVRFVVRRLDKR